jgi:hypothetical protein
MHKKLIMACVATAAFAAFAVPPASAAQLTENGTAVPVGASITGRSTVQVKITSAAFTFECTSTHVVGTVTANSSGTIAGEIPIGGLSLSGTGPGGDCTSSLGSAKPTVTSKMCLHIAKGTDTGTMTGCGEVIRFKLDFTGVITCKYEAPSISGTILTGANDAEILGLEQAVIVESPAPLFCPKEAKIDTQWALTTTDGTTLKFS